MKSSFKTRKREREVEEWIQEASASAMPQGGAPPPDSSEELDQRHQQEEKVYAVELYFDPALENQVLKAWNVLARRQISTYLIDMAARPHLTLLSAPASSLDPIRLHAPLRSLAARLLDPLPLSLSSIGAFPDGRSAAGGGGGGVLFLAPTPSAALLGLHAQLCEALRKEGVEPPEEFRPDAWVPHCAVAQDVPRSRMAEAFCILRDLKLPVSGYAMDIGLVEFSPVCEIFSFPLGGGSEA